MMPLKSFEPWRIWLQASGKEDNRRPGSLFMRPSYAHCHVRGPWGTTYDRIAERRNPMSRPTFGGKSVSDLSLGYAVDVDPFTGASTLSIPVPASEARDGMEPELVLAYSSGGG